MFVCFEYCVLGLQDTIDFLRRSQWKMYKKRNSRECVANYFSDIDEEGKHN